MSRKNKPRRSKTPNEKLNEPQAPPAPVAVAVVLLLALVPYLNSLQGGFQYDDRHQIVDNLAARDSAHVLTARPTRALTYLTFFINYKLHGFEWMPGWHMTNILLHSACALVLYLTLRLLFKDSGARGGIVSIIAAAIFACHTLAGEPVNYVGQRSSILYAMFSLLSLCGAAIIHRSETARGRIGGGLLLAVSIFLASVSKEVGGLLAIAMPVLYLLIFVGPNLRRKKLFWSAFGGVVPAASAGAAVWMLTGGPLDVIRDQFASGMMRHHFCAMTIGFWRYVSLAILPLPSRLSVDHYVPYSPSRIYAFGDGDVLLAIAGLVIVVCLVVFFARKHPQAGILLAMVPVGIAPYFFWPSIEVVVEYKFYFSLAAVCSLAAIALNWTAGKRAWARWGVPAALCVALALMTANRNTVWRTELTLWEDAALKGPRKARTINCLAWALATDKTLPDPKRALVMAERSLDPKYVDPWWGYDPNMIDTLAEVYYVNGMYDKAIAAEEEIIRHGRGRMDFYRSQLARFRAARDGTADR